MRELSPSCRIIRVRRVSLLAFILILTLLTPSSYAHSGSTYVSAWNTNVNEDYYIDNNVPSEMRQAVRDGAIEFSDRAQGKSVAFIDRGVKVESGNTLDCGDQFDSVVFAASDAALFNLIATREGTGQHVFGYTTLCVVGGYATKFVITLVTNPGDGGWKYGTAHPASDEWDLRSVTTHEFGHAIGFYKIASCASGSGSVRHFCEDDETTCPSDNSLRQTMCPGRRGNIGTDYRRTTEGHDQHTLANAYP